MRKRISVLDSLRGLAAIFVMLFHFTSFYEVVCEPLKINSLLKFPRGFYGVQLFFMISGFVIFMTVNKITDYRKFIYKRLVRLYPTYWMCLIITTLFISFFPVKIYTVSISQFLGNITMIQGLLRIDNIDGSYWSLLPEIMFYAMMVFILLFKLQSKIIAICMIWLLGIGLNLLHPSYLEILFNLKFGIFFISGIMFYRIYLKENTYIEYLLIVISNILLYFVTKNVESTVVFFLFNILFFLFVKNRLNFLANSFLTYLGAISYPLYLIHQSIGITTINYLITLHFNPYISIFTTFFFVFFLAIVIYEYFEKPFLKMIMQRNNRE